MMTSPDLVFSQNLKKARIEQNISQKGVSLKSGVSCNTLDYIENNRRSTSLFTASIIANTLGYELYEMLNPNFEPKGE